MQARLQMRGSGLLLLLCGTLWLFGAAQAALPHFHADGPCQLWWPLNFTDVHLFPGRALRVGAEAGSGRTGRAEAETEIVLVCPGLALEEEDTSFESLVRFDGDGAAKPQRAGLVLHVVDTEGAPRGFQIKPKWHPTRPLVLPLVLSFPFGVAAAQPISVRLRRADGKLISQFADLQLLPVDVSRPRLAPTPAGGGPGAGAEAVGSRELDSINSLMEPSEAEAKRPESWADAQAHAFINSIPNRDVMGQWMSLLLPPDLLRGAALTLAEVGVRRGDFSLDTVLHGCGQLCRHWLLVDVWDQQQLSAAEYIDAANVNGDIGGAAEQEQEQAAEHLQTVRRKAARLAETSDLSFTITVAQSTSVLAAAALLEKAPVPQTAFWQDIDRSGSSAAGKRTIDFVYLDARHDYRSVVEDVCAWFPLVTPGGILAGHDYVRSRYLHKTLFTVRQAVDKFAFDLGLQLHSTREPEENFPTWFVRRPRALDAEQRAAFRRYCSVLQ